MEKFKEETWSDERADELGRMVDELWDKCDSAAELFYRIAERVETDEECLFAITYAEFKRGFLSVWG